MSKLSDDISFEHISIIGRNAEAAASKKASEQDFDGFTSGEDLPPPPPAGKRKVIVAQRPNSFLWTLKVKYRILNDYLELMEIRMTCQTTLDVCYPTQRENHQFRSCMHSKLVKGHLHGQIVQNNAMLLSVKVVLIPIKLF